MDSEHSDDSMPAGPASSGSVYRLRRGSRRDLRRSLGLAEMIDSVVRDRGLTDEQEDDEASRIEDAVRAVLTLGDGLVMLRITAERAQTRLDNHVEGCRVCRSRRPVQICRLLALRRRNARRTANDWRACADILDGLARDYGR